MLLNSYFVWCYKKNRNIYCKFDSWKIQKLSSRTLGVVTVHTILIQIFEINALLYSAQFVFTSGNVTSLFTFKWKNVCPLLSYLQECSSQSNVLVQLKFVSTLFLRLCSGKYLCYSGTMSIIIVRIFETNHWSVPQVMSFD